MKKYMKKRRIETLQKLVDVVEEVIWGDARAAGREPESPGTTFPSAPFFLLPDRPEPLWEDTPAVCCICGCPLSREERDIGVDECFSCYTIGKEAD